MKKLIFLCATFLVLPTISAWAQWRDGDSGEGNVTYVAGSTQKVCQVTGETDHSGSTGACPNLIGETAAGGNYAPYFIGTLTTGDENTGTSIFYWTMATFDPYTQMVMRTKIQGSPDPHGSDKRGR
jgi:hypothetical protein